MYTSSDANFVRLRQSSKLHCILPTQWQYVQWSWVNRSFIILTTCLQHLALLASVNGKPWRSKNVQRTKRRQALLATNDVQAYIYRSAASSCRIRWRDIYLPQLNTLAWILGSVHTRRRHGPWNFWTPVSNDFIHGRRFDAGEHGPWSLPVFTGNVNRRPLTRPVDTIVCTDPYVAFSPVFLVGHFILVLVFI